MFHCLKCGLEQADRPRRMTCEQRLPVEGTEGTRACGSQCWAEVPDCVADASPEADEKLLNAHMESVSAFPIKPLMVDGKLETDFTPVIADVAKRSRVKKNLAE